MAKTQFGDAGWLPERIKSLSGKTFVITGANTGAGFAAAKILLSKDAEVIMLNRNEEKSNQAIKDLKEQVGDEANVSFVKMDLGELASVRNAAKELLEKKEMKIEALICNAAVAQVSTQRLTPDGFESQLGINHYGHFLLVALLFPILKESRIVTVASMGYTLGLRTIQFDDMNFDKNYAANTAYSQSKLAQMMFSYELQSRIKEAGLATKVYVCHPGASKTSLINSENASYMTRMMFSLMSMLPIVQTAEQGAYPEVMCATEPDLKEDAFYGPTGRMYFYGPVGECELEPHAKDREIASKLWTVSEEKTGEKFEVKKQ